MKATDFLEEYGPRALVTGASSGTGASFARELASNDPNGLTELLMVKCHAPLPLTRGFIPRLPSRGVESAIYGPPRMFGMRLRYRFGE